MSDSSSFALVNPGKPDDERAALLVYASQAMARVVGDVLKAVRARQDLLLIGESGSGKESIVRSIVLTTDRALVPFRVADTPRELQRSEWCGYTRGAFTGADHDEQGCVERASGGVILISDVEQLDLDMQRTLRRFYDDRVVQRIGSGARRRVDVQLVLTTNADLAALSKEGKFLFDLLQRIERIVIEVPPLRARREDLDKLVPHILTRLAAEHRRVIRDIDEAFWKLARTFAWPGNVRQLESYLADAAVKDDGEVLHLACLAERVARDTAPIARRQMKSSRDAVIHTLAHAGSLGDAAAMLGISVRWLHKLRRKYGLL